MVRNPGETMYLFIAINFLFIKKSNPVPAEASKLDGPCDPQTPGRHHDKTDVPGSGLDFILIFHALQLLLQPSAT